MPVDTYCSDQTNQHVLQKELKNLVFAVYDPNNVLVNDSACECSPSIIDFKPYSDNNISTDVLQGTSLFSQHFTNLYTAVIDNQEFQNLFFSASSKSYTINASQKFNPAIDFGSQILSLGHEDVKFSLFDACCDKFTEKNGCYPDPVKLINLNKELSLVKSLYDLKCNTKALTYDGIIEFFTSTNQIKKQDCKPITKVVALPLSIQVNFYCVSLDVVLLMQFNYLVSLPGYDIVHKINFELPIVSPNNLAAKTEEISTQTKAITLASDGTSRLTQLVDNEASAQCKLTQNLNDLLHSEYVSELQDEQGVTNYGLTQYEQNKSLELIYPIACSVANNYDSEFNYQLGQIEVYHLDTCLNKSASFIEGVEKQLGLDPTPFEFLPLELNASDYLTPLNLCTELNPPQIQQLVIVPPESTMCSGNTCSDEST
jgi:hypothetical protein